MNLVFHLNGNKWQKTKQNPEGSTGVPWSVKSTKSELLASGQKRKYVGKPYKPLIWDLECLETGLEDLDGEIRIPKQVSGHMTI